MKGKGVEYLTFSFSILKNQTYKNFEVVISDHSINSDIEDLCKAYSKDLNIQYHRYEVKRGISSANLNNCIAKAQGEVIKILFQDDFLYDETSLENCVAHYLGNTNSWLVSACAHYKAGTGLYNPFYPKYHDNIQYGENTISSPSVLMFKNEDVEFFDENIFWLMDVDYYKRMYDKFGLPSICNYITVVNREHENQVTNTLATQNIRQQELSYIKEKYENIR
jgi:glycosyltransferase involved in cell wall biosynthesis